MRIVVPEAPPTHSKTTLAQVKIDGARLRLGALDNGKGERGRPP
jgi:hypothetical protein